MKTVLFEPGIEIRYRALPLTYSCSVDDCDDVMRLQHQLRPLDSQQWAEAIQTQHLIFCGVVLLAIFHVQTQGLFILVLTSCLVSLLL
jgi:hypothetical protein